MKKIVIYSIAMVVVLSLGACGTNGNNNIIENKNDMMEYSEKNNSSEGIDGIEMFSDELCDSIIEIDYYSFDESKTVINDSEKMKEVLRLLQSQNYQKLGEDEMIEGLHDMVFITENETYGFGVAKDIIAFGGNQYKVNVKDNLAVCIFEILEIKQE